MSTEWENVSGKNLTTAVSNQQDELNVRFLSVWVSSSKTTIPLSVCGVKIEVVFWEIFFFFFWIDFYLKDCDFCLLIFHCPQKLFSANLKDIVCVLGIRQKEEERKKIKTSVVCSMVCRGNFLQSVSVWNDVP